MRTRVLILIGLLAYLTFIQFVTAFAVHATLASALAEEIGAPAPSAAHDAIHTYLVNRTPTHSFLLVVPAIAALGLSLAILLKDCGRSPK